MIEEKKVIVVGDRVLIKPDESRERTSFGLYLPQGVESKDKVQGGYVVKVGPGYPLPDPSSMNDEPWGHKEAHDVRYMPLQAQEGDYALFVRKASVEIDIDREKYLIVSQAAILLLIRDDLLERLQDSQEE